MGVGQTIGTGGFISWFYAVIYVNIRRVCKNIVIKFFIHSVGLLLMIIGLYFLIALFLSPPSIVGLFLTFIGFVIFMIPMDVE